MILLFSKDGWLQKPLLGNYILIVIEFLPDSVQRGGWSRRSWEMVLEPQSVDGGQRNVMISMLSNGYTTMDT